MAVSSGTAPYTYAWSNTATTPSISGLAAGTYNVTVSDAAGCSTVLTIKVAANSGLLASLSSTNAYCGANNGSATATVTGGNGVYTYHWNNGSSSATASNLGAGVYFVTVTDGNGCSTTQFKTVRVNNGPLVHVDSVTNITCASNTGAANISVTGGVAPYTYAWSNGSSAQNQAGLNGGLYVVTVTDANGCVAVGGVQISSSPAIAVVANKTNPACSSTAGGSIDVTSTGGLAPYTYAWSNSATSPNLSGLASGTYTVTVTDANGCTVSTPVVITAPQPIATRINTTNVTCSGGSNGAVSVNVTGGTAPYSFNWSNGATTSTVNNLTAGVYMVTVVDAGGCSASRTVTVATINTLVLNTGSSDASCGQNNGFATVSVSGGSGNYTYHWSNNRSNAVDSLVGAGSYNVTVTDATNGCTATASVAVGNITSIVVTGSASDARCGANDGAVSVTVTGGSPGYSYHWNNNATTSGLNNLAEGIYTVTVTDTTGCSKVASFTVHSIGTLSISSTITDANCGNSDGSITANVSGGGNVTLLWSTGATSSTISNIPAGLYSVTATDANGCSSTAFVTVNNADGPLVTVDSVTNLTCTNGSLGAIAISASGAGPITFYWSDSVTTQNRTGLPAGTYAVTVTGSGGCVTIVTATVSAPDAIVIFAHQQNIRCNGDSTGSVTMAVSGGIAPYSYSWSNGSHASSLSNLRAGNYGVTVTDANGCVAFTPIIIGQPQPISVTLDSFHNASCSGALTGMIHVTAQGGVAPYTYTWNPTATGNYLTGLGAGTYSLTVTDASGCINGSFTKTLTQPGNLTLTISQIDSIKCHGDKGSITVAASGGTAPYVYTWNDSTHGATHGNLGAGTYSVTVTDAGGCSISLPGILLTEPATLVANATGTAGLCSGYTDGTVFATVTGGTAPYTYSWTGGATTDTVHGLGSGTYTVTVRDANGCTAITSTTLRSITPLDILTGSIVHQPICADTTSGTITLHVTGGTGAYHYSWTPASTDSALTGLGRGTYTVTVTDGNACSLAATFTLSPGNCGPRPHAIDDTAQTTQNHNVRIPVLDNDTFVPPVTPVVVDSPKHGTIVINPDGTITYDPAHNYVGIDTFTYVICDGNGCDTANVYVYVLPERPNVQIPNGFSPNGDNVNDYFEIPDILKYPGSQLIIFNRWGNTVWESDKSGYVNNWNGVNENNEPLPDGTYFYIITMKDGQDTKYEGFVTIHR